MEKEIFISTSGNDKIPSLNMVFKLLEGELSKLLLESQAGFLVLMPTGA